MMYFESSSDGEASNDDLQQSDVDDDAHNKLLDAISSLDKNKKKSAKKQRTEASVKVDEFNLSEGKDTKIKLGDLIGSLKKSSSHVKLKKQLRTTSKQRVVQPPLEKPQAERTLRAVAYEKASKDMDKWNNIVQKNRLAEQIVYPLKETNLRIQPIEEVAKRFAPKTDMEIEIAEALNTSKNVMTKDRELTVAEEEALKAMSLEEALERRNELRKMRALQSYQESKARRQNKIKSKKYHRILKKEKMKKKMKEFEELQKANPELALEKLEEMDKNRVTERMSLKHRNTGKWAKHNMIRAKYDSTAREALREQVQINKKLTERKEIVSDSEEEEAELLIDIEKRTAGESSTNEGPANVRDATNVTNPWMKVTNSKQQVVAVESAEESEDDNIDETLQRKTKMEEFSQIEEVEPKVLKVKKKQQRNGKQEVTKPVEVDPTKFMSLEAKKLKSQGPDLSKVDDEVMDNDDDEEEQSQYMTIAEAFADDDVIEEFKTNKEAIVRQDTPKDVDLTLPGWGSWGGSGIKVSARKRRRFTIKAAPAKQRKDAELGNVIINQNENSKLAKHQVSELPHPFNNIKQFKNSIRMPIGRTWNPETAFRELTKPKIVTKLGAVIEPIDSDAIIKGNNTGGRRRKVNKVNKKDQLKVTN